jgi:predicted transcriptional regulator of viral defense system
VITEESPKILERNIFKRKNDGTIASVSLRGGVVDAARPPVELNLRGFPLHYCDQCERGVRFWWIGAWVSDGFSSECTDLDAREDWLKYLHEQNFARLVQIIRQNVTKYAKTGDIMSENSTKFQSAIDTFKQSGGMLRMSEAVAKGISRYTLYAMRDAGIIDALTRGVYRLNSTDGMTNPDLATVARRCPDGVIYLISALSFHELTTQVPHVIELAIPRESRAPRIKYPPTNTYRVSGDAYSQGVETHTIDGVPVRIYSPEKSIADIFKYRNKLGMDVALESLQMWAKHKERNINMLMKYAKICRVEKVIRPYVEALL